jgi:type IX secretion system PorP/SprF family membrane protein
MKKTIRTHSAKLIFSLFAALSTQVTTVYAQDEGVFNHYILNPVLINPAFSGQDNKHYLFAHYRQQWSGVEGAPTTYALSYNGQINENIGIGAYGFSEKVAALERQRGQLSYAYHFNERHWKAGVGFSTEFHRIKLDPSVIDGSRNSFYEIGDILAEDAINGFSFFDATFGANFVLNEKFFVGLSTPNLIRARLGTFGRDSDRRTTTFRQILLYTGYKFKTSGISIEPSLQTRRVLNAPFEVDFNCKAGFLEDKLILAGTYRPGPSGMLSLMVGTRQPTFPITRRPMKSRSVLNSTPLNPPHKRKKEKKKKRAKLKKVRNSRDAIYRVLLY